LEKLEKTIADSISSAKVLLTIRTAFFTIIDTIYRLFFNTPLLETTQIQ